MASLLLAAVVQSLHLTGAGGLERGSAVPWPWLTAAPVRAGEAAWGETADSERAQRRLTALVAAACRSLRACVRACVARRKHPVHAMDVCSHAAPAPCDAPRPRLYPRSPFRNPTASVLRPLPQAAGERRPGAMEPAAPLLSPRPPAVAIELIGWRPLPELTARARARAPSTAAGE